MSATLRYRDREIAPQEFDDAARRVAGGLARLGIGEGDVLCIMLRNVPAFLESMRAARMLGAFYCTINWHYRSEEAGWILRDSGAKALVIDPALHAQIAQGVPAGLPIVYTCDWERWRGAQPAWQGAERRPGTLMPYTSGTTGRAKGVRRLAPPAAQAQAATALLQQNVAQVLGIEPGMRAILPAPLYHSAPAGYGLQATLNGELLVLEDRFDAERTLALIERHRLTHAYLVPTMYVRLLRLHPEVKGKYDLSSMRFVASTGSPCPAEVKRAMIEWWGPVFYESYAASELGYVTLVSSQEALRKPGAAGRPVGQASIRILDADGLELPRGKVGLIYCRQPAFPDFIYNNAEALMPGVRDCAVFGIPDEEFGEALAAAVQTDPGIELQAEAVRDYLAARIAGYKVPKVVAFHGELPREDSGKIFKRRLRDPYWENSGRRI